MRSGVFRRFANSVLRAIERGLDEFHLAILQRHVEAAQRAPRRDVAAHDAGADDVHVLDAASRCRPRPFRRSCRKNTRMRLRQVGVCASFATERASSFRRCVMLDPPRRQTSISANGRRIVIRPCLRGGLLAHDRREDLPHRPDVRRPRLGALPERARARDGESVPSRFRSAVRARSSASTSPIDFAASADSGAAGQHQLASHPVRRSGAAGARCRPSRDGCRA